MDMTSVPIRTPDQRLRVFVSSTLQELAADRQAVREAIAGLRLTPVLFEQGARPHPPRALYRAYLEQSDVFIGLYWERYGWVAPGEEISGLEDEYDLSADRPKLIYIKTPAPNREPRLARLLARIQSDERVSYRLFSDPDELRSLVADDLALLLTEHFVASAARGPRTTPSNGLGSLPRPPTRLIDRTGEVASVLSLLADPDARMVTIVGTGGIGKSRVALAVAEGARGRLVEEVAYVDLAAITEPSLVVPTVARALGLKEGGGMSIATQLRDRLPGVRTLVVLDNMERLTDAAGDVADLLAEAEAIRLLVTSRRRLDIRGELVFALEPLAVPASEGAITPAVELFLERARTIRLDYHPSGDDMAAIAELTRRLDGLPLAIELACARLRLLSPAAVLQRMGRHRLSFLRSGARDLPTRQRTLRDTITWSHGQLGSDSQAMFARFSVFVGSADLQAIDQVANPDGALDTLEVLADLYEASLLRTLDEGAEPRFGMLETIREFAVERLAASGEAAFYLDRHRAHYLELAERGNAALGTAEQLEWLDRLDLERDNIRAVLRRAMRQDDAATAARLGRAMNTYWQMRGAYSEGRSWMDRVAQLPSAGPRERAVAWLIGAVQAFLQGNWELLDAGLDDVARLLDGEDQRTVALAQVFRAISRGGVPGNERWHEDLTEAVRRLQAEGEPLAIGFGLVASARLARLHGRLEEAQRLAQQALELSTHIGEWFVRTYATMQLARVALELGDHQSARRHAVETFLAARRLANLSATCDALELWALAELRGNQVSQAGRLFALAERGYREAGHTEWRPDIEFHHQVTTELLAAVGVDAYEHLLADTLKVDLEESFTELAGPEQRSR